MEEGKRRVGDGGGEKGECEREERTMNREIGIKLSIQPNNWTSAI